MNKKPRNFTISDDIYELLTKRAKEEHRSRSEHIEHLIAQDSRFAQIPVIGRIENADTVKYPNREK